MSENWKGVFVVTKTLSVEKQQENSTEIIEAFREMWASRPSEKEFADYMYGIVIFAEFDHIMAMNPLKTGSRKKMRTKLFKTYRLLLLILYLSMPLIWTWRGMREDEWGIFLWIVVPSFFLGNDLSFGDEVVSRILARR